MQNRFRILMAFSVMGLIGLAAVSALPSYAQVWGIQRRVGGSQCVPLYSGNSAYQNDLIGFFYDDGASGTGYANCPTAEHTSATLTALSADLKYEDTSATRCMSCYWYIKTHNGSTYYSSFRYSDGGNGASCVSSYVGFGTMTWSNLGWGQVSNVAQLNALCVLPRAGGRQKIRSYRVSTDVSPL